MASLWRILALAWLGGIGSPALVDDAIAVEPLEAEVSSAEPAPTYTVLPEARSNDGDSVDAAHDETHDRSSQDSTR
jgi:hypothetical protein